MDPACMTYMMMLCLYFSCIQKLLLHEREKREQAETAWRKLLEKCRLLFNQLQECNVNLPYEDEDRTSMNSSSLTGAFNQLTVSDDQIDILLAEVQVFLCFYQLQSRAATTVFFKCNSFSLRDNLFSLANPTIVTKLI